MAETRGRPRISEGGMAKLRPIRVPDDQWDQWQAEAKRRKVSVAELIRSTVNRSLARRK